MMTLPARSGNKIIFHIPQIGVNLKWWDSEYLKIRQMKNSTLVLLLSLITLSGLAFTACNKENVNPAVSQQPSGGLAATESMTFQNVTIETAQDHIFFIPAITQPVIDRGSVKVYASDATNPAMQWNALPIIDRCGIELNVTAFNVGSVDIKNTLGTPVTMSYRFDIVVPAQNDQ
jgi:hypothetical protein